MDEQVDVAVVGCGPVGLTLAILLGQRGRRVAVFERQAAPYPLPRAVHLDHEVARILQSAGLGDQLAELTEPADTYEWRNATGDTLLLIGSKESSVSGWPASNMFSQPALERALVERIRALPSVSVHRACEVVGLEPGDAAVELQILSRPLTRATWVAGCDGARSFVREQIGATVSDLGFCYDWLIVDVVPHERRVWNPINWQLCDPARPTTVVSGGPGRRRWEFMRLPGESITELDSEATAWRLLAPWDVTPDNATLERHAVYTFQARVADTWRSGRVLLAGDAAHQMPPYAGQGMCAGIRDAANLAWKLDLVLAGAAPDALLDTYASERIPQVRQVIAFSIELGKVICVADPEAAATRDAAMMARVRETGPTPPLPTPGIGPGLLLDGDARAGQLFVQGQVRHRGLSGRFDDVVGRGFVLVSPEDDPARHLESELAARFASLGGTCAHVAPGAAVDDADGSYARWFASSGAAVALQRPDFHVFGTASRCRDAGLLVRRLLDALARGGPV